MSFGLYRANQVIVQLGTIGLSDMRADSFINVRYDGAMFEVIKGSDGSITRYCTHETLAHVDLIFKRSSNEGQKLSALLIQDLIVPGGAGVVPFLMKDLQGASLLSAEHSWITGFPDSANAKDVGADLTWIIDMQILPGQHIIGGNQLV